MSLKMRNARNAIIALLILALPVSLQAQITFERYYGEPSAYSIGKEVFQKNDKGYIFGGSTQFSGTDIYFYLVRTDSFGDTLWTRFYGGNQSDYGQAMDTTIDGGYIIAGSTNSFGAGSTDVYLVKTDSLGDSVWTRTYGGPFEDIGYSIKQTVDGGFIIAGRTKSFGAGGIDAYLIRTDSLGDTLWTRTYGDSLTNIAGCVEIAPDNNFVIAGRTETPSSGVRAFITKVDTLGNVIWTKPHGAAWTEAYSIRNTIDGGFIVTGRAPAPFTVYYVYLLKTDSLGDSLWSKRIGLDYGSGDERHNGYSVQQTIDGGYVIAGYTSPGEFFQNDLFLIRTNTSGDTLWTRIYGYLSGASETGYSVKETHDGGYIISGHSTGGGHGQAYLIKTDTLGIVGVQEKKDIRQRTQAISLFAHPNPFTSVTTIFLYLPSMEQRSESIELRIYDVAGRMVKQFTLLPTQRMPISVTWDGRDNRGEKVKSGVYFIQLSSDRSVTSRVILIR